VADDQTPAAVSVALCTFNGAEFVAEQVRSILTQSHRPSQLVIADDGSTDGTLDVVAGEIAAASRSHPGFALDVVMLQAEKSPLGVAGNFERALRACTEPLIALCDQDDVWHPDRLARLVAAFEGDPQPGLIHHDAQLVDAAGADLGVTLFGALGIGRGAFEQVAAGLEFELLMRRNISTGATTILGSDVRDLALPIPPGWIHDEWLAIVAAAVSRTAIVDEPLIDYRQHGANQIGVRKVTVADRLDRLREPREPRNSRLLLRARSLVERLARFDDVDPARVALARRKFAHEGRRSALPAARLLRVPGVAAGVVRGDYRRFGNGAQDVLRDLVQPAFRRAA
jgi:glycosyltransferase involved in cell wall biosynthesis